MTNIDKAIDLIQSAANRSEVKNAVQECLAATKSISSDHQRSSAWFPLGECLVRALNPSFVGVFSKREYEELFVDIFVRAPTIDSIPLLLNSLKVGQSDKKSNYAVEKCLRLLDTVVRKNLSKLFIDSIDHRNAAMEETETTNRLIQDLASIPDRTAAVIGGGGGRLRDGDGSVFNVDAYCKTVAVALIEALKCSHRRLVTAEADCSLKFLSDVLGKFYMSGRGSAIMRVLAPCLYGLCCGGGGGSNDRRAEMTNDFVWRRLSTRLFTGVHSLALDGVIADLVLILSDRDPGKMVDLEKLLGNAVEKEDKIKYVLINKLLLIRQFDRTLLVPETIIRYLANTDERRRTILQPTLIKLLTIWSSPTFVTRSSLEKHFYVSRSILIACSRLSPEDRERVRNEASMLVMRGMGSHLNAVDENLRKIGMVTGELLTSIFVESSGDRGDKLKFDYVEDEQTVYLKSIHSRRDTDDFVVISADLSESLLEQNSTASSAGHGSQYEIAAGLDSDDEDLVPYDMPEETANDYSAGGSSIKESSPVYIKDCLDSIVERKSFNSYEIALKNLEQLIHRNSPGADDLALEIVQVLLHAEDHYGLDEEFAARQRSIMVASCVRQPKRVATFLAGEFYEKNYSIQHRLLILDVLVEAAKELSKPTTKADGEPNEDGGIEIVTIGSKSRKEPMAPTPMAPTWRQVVQTRIETRTRRWGSAVTGQKSTTPRTAASPTSAAPNRFAPVAGPCFFYPLLLEIDKRIETLDMFGADYIVLGRLLFATGTILFEAENAPGSNSMAAAQLRLALGRAIRHEQPFVRQGALFGLIMALMTIPSRLLAAEYRDELLEAQTCLQCIIADDPDEQCRMLADQAARIVAKKANEGLNGMIQVGLK